jgi:hypothetical protein
MVIKGTMGTTTKGTTSKSSELLIVTKNELGMFARITTPLAKNNINIECFTGYEWGTEAAFRLITDNNRKAYDLLKREGYNVTETPVVLWQTNNTPGQMRAATTALAEAHVNTYCSYSTTMPGSDTTTVAFTTNNPDRVMDVLKRLG